MCLTSKKIIYFSIKPRFQARKKLIFLNPSMWIIKPYNLIKKLQKIQRLIASKNKAQSQKVNVKCYNRVKQFTKRAFTLILNNLLTKNKMRLNHLRMIVKIQFINGNLKILVLIFRKNHNVQRQKKIKYLIIFLLLNKNLNILQFKKIMITFFLF